MKLDKHLLNKASDRISFLYVDMARIEQTEFSIDIVQGIYHKEIPVTSINALFIGPGVSITSMAIRNLCDAGVTIIWCGQNMFRFYACGESGTNSSKNILMQMNCHESKLKHMEVVKRMYEIRYPNEKLKYKKIDELRGIEGKKVRDLYNILSEQTGIQWTGRSYKIDDYDSQDTVNKALTLGNQFLYGIIHGIIHLMGFSPAIGFIHTGHMLSFVYDIADLYKEKLTIPIAFDVASKLENENGVDLKNINDSITYLVQKKLREEITKQKLLKQITKDLQFLFSDCDFKAPEIEGMLWSYDNFVKSGVNYKKI
jgi:CRISPR-associated protein Cas1